MSETVHERVSLLDGPVAVAAPRRPAEPVVGRPAEGAVGSPAGGAVGSSAGGAVGRAREQGLEESPLVEYEVLVEEISIDGMCGVY